MTRQLAIHLPPGLRLLNANQRVHHRVRAEITARIRAAAKDACGLDPVTRAALVEAGDGPAMDRAYILGVLHPPSRRRADPANWYPSFKAAVDGLVDAGILTDDDHTRLVGPDMRIGAVIPGGRISLYVQEITAAEHAAFQWRTAS